MFASSFEGQPKQEAPADSVDALRQKCESSNEKLFHQLKEGKFSKELYEQTLADAALGRMTFPTEAKDCNLKSTRVHPRFGVEQGIRPDGSMKIRHVV